MPSPEYYREFFSGFDNFVDKRGEGSYSDYIRKLTKDQLYITLLNINLYEKETGGKMIREFQSRSPSSMDKTQLEIAIIGYFKDHNKRKIHKTDIATHINNRVERKKNKQDQDHDKYGYRNRYRNRHGYGYGDGYTNRFNLTRYGKNY